MKRWRGRSVAVLGGGIQGTTVALEAARRGLEVDLFEVRPRIMTGASLHSEGKIHLGFVFANDVTLETSALQARGAGCFARLMRSWLGDVFDSVTVSRPFNYVVHADSMVAADELHRRYLTMKPLIQRHCADGAYFGIDDCHQLERWSTAETRHGYGDRVAAVFSTREIAIDPTDVAPLLVGALDSHPAVVVHPSTMVCAVDGNTRCVTIQVGESRVEMGPYDHVVNCLWSGRLAIDQPLDLLPRHPWSHRMKYFVRLDVGDADAGAPSSTIVLGRFGDVVDYGAGKFLASWYPVGRRGFSTDVVPPPWSSYPDPAESALIAEGTRDGLRTVVPDVDRLFAMSSHSAVQGGHIFAVGNTDIDDTGSMLHSRSHSGPISQGWYHSVDTGKYTTAPLFAHQTVARMLEGVAP